MGILLGISAMITAIGNVAGTLAGKNTAWLRYISISLTALTVCGFYSMNVPAVASEDWSALMDVVPTVSRLLWALTVASIGINSISLFKKR